MKIIAIAGSLRKKSFNKSLLRAAVEESPDEMDIEIFDLEGIPLFNADVEVQGDPKRVTEFKNTIRKADGVLIASPEYNHGMTGITKNALDWASRPAKDMPINGKPVAVLGASPGMTGTARSQDQLRQCLKAVNAHCMDKPEFLLFQAHGKIDVDGILTDEKSRKYLNGFLSSFAEWVNKFQHPS